MTRGQTISTLLGMRNHHPWRFVRKVYYWVIHRPVWLEAEVLRLPAWVNRIERWTRPGYLFTTRVYRAEWGEWRDVAIRPIEIRDKKGKLVALRINGDDLAGDLTAKDSPAFYIDYARLEPTPREPTGPPGSPQDRA